jgi:hypothetical protein
LYVLQAVLELRIPLPPLHTAGISVATMLPDICLIDGFLVLTIFEVSTGFKIQLYRLQALSSVIYITVLIIFSTAFNRLLIK